jgi:threonine synthase
MNQTAAVDGLTCLDCGHEDVGFLAQRCPACDGPLMIDYNSDEVGDVLARLFADGFASGSHSGLANYAPTLPIPESALVTTGEGATPLVDCPPLADDVGVDQVLLKDEGRNGTGALADREMAVAVAAARLADANTVALPSTGNDGQAAAAYAARAEMDASVYVPSRVAFQNKAMINVHGGDMSVVEGRYSDAYEAFSAAKADKDWHSLAPFETPYRQAGAKTVAYELVADLSRAPDVVIHPTGHGTALLGIQAGFEELDAAGVIDHQPRLVAAQPSGCAPITTAWEQSSASLSIDQPDTICGELEVPAPPGGEYVLDALDATDGEAVAPDDEALLEAATSLAGNGVPVSATGGTGIAGAQLLADRGSLDADDTVVVINPASANREADVLRSHLMRKGI